MKNTFRFVNNKVTNCLWVLSYEIEEKRMATNAHLIKLKTNARQAVRRLKHDRR